MGKRFESFYASLFSKPALRQFNKKILSAALRARGYNNYRNDTESGERFFIRNVLAPSNPRVCIDIGANVGSFTKELLTSTQARVISFEPLPQAFRELQATTREFGKRSIAENKGVGENCADLLIHYNPEKPDHASFSEASNNVPYVENTKELLVEVVSLDAYLDLKPVDALDFIKIDTEGFEGEVLKGALGSIDRYAPRFIQVEFNWHHLFRNISLNNLSELLPEYDAYQLLPNGWAKRDPVDPLSNIYEFANFVFVRKGSS